MDEAQGLFRKYTEEALKGLSKQDADKESRIRAIERILYERAAMIDDYAKSKDAIHVIENQLTGLEKDFNYLEKRQVRSVAVISTVAVAIIEVALRMIEKFV